MSQLIELIQRTKPWEANQTSITAWPVLEKLPRYQQIYAAGVALAGMILEDIKTKAAEDGMPLLILTARVTLDCSCQMDTTVTPPPKRKGKKT